MNSKKIVLTNLGWRLLERFGAQGVTLLVSILLARILAPEVYGVIALVSVITNILQVFVDSGLGVALIQKENADEMDFSTVFYFNLFICIFLYTLLYALAPIISSFYNMPEITSVIRTLGIILIISGFKNIQNSYVSRHMQFKKYFFATLGGTLAAAVIGVWMAYHGYGIWALVAQNLVNQFIDTVILWIIVKWRPKCLFSFQRLRVLLSYGWKLLASSLIDTVWTQLRQLIIGKKYSSNDLAFFNKGQEYPHYATTAINSSIDSVMFPVMSGAQNDKTQLKNITRRSIKISSYIMWPFMLGFAACATSFVRLLLTDKWLQAVPYLQIYCIVYAFQPIHTANLNAIKAMGRSDVFLKIEIIKKAVNLSIILISMNFGVFWIAAGTIIGSIINQIVNSWPNRNLLGYSYREQIIDILPAVTSAALMAFIVSRITYLELDPLITLILQVPVGIALYILFSKLMHIESYQYCIDLLISLRRNKN